MNISDAVIVAISNKDFDILSFWIIYACYATWFVQTRIESLLILESCSSISQPGEYFVVEGVYHFYFVVVGICNCDHILLWNKCNTKRMLQLGCLIRSVLITICMQVLWIGVSSDQTSRSDQRLHVDGSDGGALRIGDVQLDFRI